MIKQRIEKIQSELNDTSALLITSKVNRFYFTGFHSSAGTVIITKKTADFFIDFRYFEKAKKTVNSCEVHLAENKYKDIFNILTTQKISDLFVETDTLSISKMLVFKKYFEGINILNDDKFSKKIAQMRSVKSENELKLIKQAQKITDETFSYILNRIYAGRTEKEVMLDMEFYLRSHGADAVSFDFIVISGKNTSVPHGTPTDKIIENGDFVTMDFGAECSGYRSDMTRTIAVGKADDEQKNVYNTVLKAQLLALENIKAGAVCKDIDKMARDYIYSQGYEGNFGHALGHSVGIEIHEFPNLNMSDETVLVPGMIETVEPGIYLENKFGVRIEDMVCITENGCENLTESKKELIIL